MLAQIGCAVLGIVCALYGVYMFTKSYTCRVTSFSKGLNNACMKVAWVPSGCIVGVVLAIAVWKSSSLI